MNNDTKAKLENFISIAEKVRDSKFMSENQNASFSLSVGVGKPLEQSVSGFDENDLRSLLIDLRKFTLAKDGVRFTNICELLRNTTKDPEIIKNVESCQSQYEKLMDNSTVNLIIDGDTNENLKVLQAWFYGHYFHEQPKHKNKLAQLGIGETMHKFSFVQLVQSLSYLSCILANNAKLVLKEQEN